MPYFDAADFERTMTEPVAMFRRDGRGRAAPATVRWSTYLLALILVAGVVTSFATTGNSSAAYAVGQILGAGVALLLLRQISFGRRWARTLALILLAVSGLTNAVRGGHVASGFALVSVAVLAVLEAVVAGLLYAPSGNEYFDGREPPGRSQRLGVRGSAIAGTAIAVIAAAGLISGLLTRPESSVTASVPHGSGVNPAATQAPPAGPGTVFRWNVGHFAVRFQTSHNEQVGTRAVGNDTVTVHQSADPSFTTLVTCFDFVQGIVTSGSGTTDFLAGELHGLEQSLRISFDQASHTSFHSRPAIEATFHDSSGALHSALVVLYGSQRSYVLYGPGGATFDALKRSFVALR